MPQRVGMSGGTRLLDVLTDAGGFIIYVGSDGKLHVTVTLEDDPGRDLEEREPDAVVLWGRCYESASTPYEAMEGVVDGLSRPIMRIELGTAEIREIFRSSKIGNIAGCMVTSGVIRRNAKARLIRDGAVVSDNLTIAGLRRFKDDATEVREGFECGIGLGSFNDLQIDDVIETYEMREKPRA